MRPGIHFHLFCSSLQFGKWLKMLPRAREKKEANGDGGESIATKNGQGKGKRAGGVLGVPLHYTRKEGSMMTKIFCRNSHYVNFHKQSVHIWRKLASYIDILNHLNY